MKADKPWQFLASCFELESFRKWQHSFLEDSVDTKNIDEELEKLGVNPYDYESQLECYIDGSNNGSQHLAALTKDEVTAPHVNLVPLDLPGDLYKYVSDHVWKHLTELVSQYDKHQIDSCNRFIDNLIDLKKQILNAEAKSERRKTLIGEIRKFKDTYADLMKVAAPVYWLRITDNKQRRKIVKRNVMTLPLTWWK